MRKENEGHFCYVFVNDSIALTRVSGKFQVPCEVLKIKIHFIFYIKLNNKNSGKSNFKKNVIFLLWETFIVFSWGPGDTFKKKHTFTLS